MGFEQTTYAIKPEHLAHWTMAAVGDWRVTLLCHTPQYFLLIIAATRNFSDVDERDCAVGTWLPRRRPPTRPQWRLDGRNRRR